MLSDSGEARIQVFPVEDVNQGEALDRFVYGVREVWPDATGLAVNLFEFGRVTSASMIAALIYAGVAIALLLSFLWRSVADTALAMTPLVLGAWLRPGAHLDLVGGYKPEMIETDVEALRRSRVFVDARETTVEVCGDLCRPIAAGEYSAEHIEGIGLVGLVGGPL